MQDLTRRGPSTVDQPSGASQLVLSGELTEGVSDLSEAMTAPGGVPALREVNQNRSNPDAPFVEEQNQPGQGNYRRIVRSAGTRDAPAWDTVSPSGRGPQRVFPPRPHAVDNPPPHRPEIPGVRPEDDTGMPQPDSRQPADARTTLPSRQPH